MVVEHGEEVHALDVSSVQTQDDRAKALTNEEEQSDLMELSLQKIFHIPCFNALDTTRCTVLYTTQVTCSNVVSTVVTARAVDNPKRQQQSSDRCSSSSSSPSPLLGGVFNSRTTSKNQEHSPLLALSVYAQPCGKQGVLKKRQKGGKYHAQLPAFRRSLPALPIPITRLNQELKQERDRFMKQLQNERREKEQLENWAATKIQACYRGFRSRPRLITYVTKQRLNNLTTIRFDLSAMQEQLRKAEEPTEDTTSVSPWQKDIKDRARRKHEIKARKDRMHRAAILIQACVKRFLAQFSYANLIARHYDELYLYAVIKIQSVFRGYRLRAKILRIVAKLQQSAVLQIQSLIRGIQARERVAMLKFEQKCHRHRRIGEPLRFTLPHRVGARPTSSSIKSLYEHRKTRAQLEFRTAKWHEERMYLHIHTVSMKLFKNQTAIQRLLFLQDIANQKETNKTRRVQSASSKKTRHLPVTRTASSNNSNDKSARSSSPSPHATFTPTRSR